MWCGMGGMKTSIEVLRCRGSLRGFDRLGDEELLSLVLGGSGGRENGTPAHELIEHFGGLVGLGGAEVEEFMSFRGVGRAGALRLKALFEVGRRYVTSCREQSITKIRSPEDVAALMVPEMRELDREHFKAILLNTKNCILKIVTVAIGSLNAALVHPREIFKAAVVASAAGIIIVHNHPTGNPEPSREDKELTVRFARCGELMGIDLVDHIIIGGNRFTSMREMGMVTD